MSATTHQGQAERDQLLNACTAQEISQLHMPVLDKDFQDWRLPVPTSSTPCPWRTRAEFMIAVFFFYEETEAWCRENSSSNWIAEEIRAAFRRRTDH